MLKKVAHTLPFTRAKALCVLLLFLSFNACSLKKSKHTVQENSCENEQKESLTQIRHESEKELFRQENIALTEKYTEEYHFSAPDSLGKQYITLYQSSAYRGENYSHSSQKQRRKRIDQKERHTTEKIMHRSRKEESKESHNREKISQLSYSPFIYLLLSLAILWVMRPLAAQLFKRK